MNINLKFKLLFSFCACIAGFFIGFWMALNLLPPANSKTDTSREEYQYFFSTRAVYQESLISGWAQPEEWGVWSIGKRAVLRLPIKNNRLKSLEAQLHFQIFCDLNAKQNIGVFINDLYATTWTFHGKTNLQSKRLRFDMSSFPAANSLKISFHISNPISPKEIKTGQDNRKLGIGLNQIRFTTTSLDPYKIIQQ